MIYQLSHSTQRFLGNLQMVPCLTSSHRSKSLHLKSFESDHRHNYSVGSNLSSFDQFSASGHSSLLSESTPSPLPSPLLSYIKSLDILNHCLIDSPPVLLPPPQGGNVRPNVVQERRLTEKEEDLIQPKGEWTQRERCIKDNTAGVRTV